PVPIAAELDGKDLGLGQRGRQRSARRRIPELDLTEVELTVVEMTVERSQATPIRVEEEQEDRIPAAGERGRYSPRRRLADARLPILAAECQRAAIGAQRRISDGVGLLERRPDLAPRLRIPELDGLAARRENLPPVIAEFR